MNFNVMDPDPLTRVELAIEDIRAGRMVILIDDEDDKFNPHLQRALDAECQILPFRPRTSPLLWRVHPHPAA